MTFAHPRILLALLLLPVVALLYIRRAGKREAAVPTLMLWKTAAAEAAAETGKRMGSLDLPLILALLCLAAAIIGAAGPTLLTGASAAPHILVIADRSASMGTKTESGATRWARSVEDIARLLGRLDGGKVTLIGLPLAAGPAIEELTPAEARSRLSDASPTDMPLDLIAGLSRCAGIARNASAVIVLTDNAAITPKTLAGRPVFVISHGGPSNNAAIDALDVTTGEGGIIVFAAVTNHGGRPLAAALHVRADGELIDEAAAQLAPREGMAVTSQIVRPNEPKEIVVELKPHDDLASDNRAAATLSGPDRFRVAHVGRGNQFITRALGLLPGVTVSQFRLTEDVEGVFDLYIYDGVTPDKLPAGDVILIDPVGTVGAFTVRGAAADPSGLRVTKAKDSPLLRHVDVGALRFTRLITVRADGAAALLTSAEGNGTALMQWEDKTTRVTVIGCGLVLPETNWPQLPSFPIFWSNVIDEVAGRRTAHAPTYSLTGEHIAVRGRGDGTLSLRGPNGETVPLIAGRGARSYFLPTRAGIYTVSSGDTKTSYAVNMMHPTESANAGTSSALSEDDERAILAPGQRGGVPLWRHLAVAALVLALAYWGLATRTSR
ncbi:MAG: BatA domain-containing protein [Planctomycetota bacterium]